MSSVTFGQKIFIPRAPDKGSFPLDHDGVCKREMLAYMKCLRDTDYNNSVCREASRNYLACRMEHNLMSNEEWSKLGFSDEESKQ